MATCAAITARQAKGMATTRAGVGAILAVSEIAFAFLLDVALLGETPPNHPTRAPLASTPPRPGDPFRRADQPPRRTRLRTRPGERGRAGMRQGAGHAPRCTAHEGRRGA